ncbi:MAG TPA: hypothetical protein VES97_04150 [Solirubrobacteraceae bacterium]|nr:hypothetical protein [Solirubrobacteraceae bacterium]
MIQFDDATDVVTLWTAKASVAIKAQRQGFTLTHTRHNRDGRITGQTWTLPAKDFRWRSKLRQRPRTDAERARMRDSLAKARQTTTQE